MTNFEAIADGIAVRYAPTFERLRAETDAPPDTDPDEDLTEEDSGAVETEEPEKEPDR